MSEMLIYVCIFLFSVLISSISQVMLKKSTQQDFNSILKEYLNPKVIISYSMFFFSTILTIFAYKKVPLSYGPVLESTGYIYVTVLSALVLKEKITIKKTVGTTIIIIGILTFTFVK